MAIVGGMGTTYSGYHPGHHHLGQHAMYATSPHNAHSDRPFKCETCQAGFNRNHDLKRHTKIHLAIKPFPCNYCDKSFSRKDALKVRLNLLSSLSLSLDTSVGDIFCRSY